MKKILLIFISLVLLGCEEQNFSSKPKIISEQNFNCLGSYSNKEFHNNLSVRKNPIETSGKVEYPMIVRKLDKPLISEVNGKMLGDILLGSDKTFPICYEDKFEIIFFPTCNVSSPQEKLPNSNHRGVINKFDGNLSYKVEYDYENVRYVRNLSLECKPVTQTIVK